MSRTSLWVGLSALLVGVLIGTLVMRALRVTPEPTLPNVRLGAPSEEEAVQRAPATSEPVQIGSEDGPPAPEYPELMSINRLFTQVADEVKPSVVFIRVDTRGGYDPYYDGQLPSRSAGSGVIVSPEGYVVTNAHVVEGAVAIQVLLNDMREYEAELVGADPSTDLAVVRLLRVDDDEALPVAALGDSDELLVGEWVLAVGNPYRLTSTVTAGIISAMGRQVDVIEDDFRIEDFIQTDAAINPGNSGGAVVNMRGEVVGIAAAIATESGGSEGYGFAIPINLARRTAEDLIAFGEVRRGFLGVEIQPVTAADANEFGMDRVQGVLISNVAEGGPAARAGLRVRDVLLRVNGEPVDAPNQFQSRLALNRPDEAVMLEVWRDGALRELSARLVDREDPAFQRWIAGLQTGPVTPPAPETPPEEVLPDEFYEAAAWGVGLRDLTGQERRTFGVPGGAFVAFVGPGSIADVDGLPGGAVITRIEDAEVTSAAEARTALADAARARADALVQVRREDGRVAFYDLQAPNLVE